MKRYLPFVIVGIVALAAIGGGAMLYRAKRPSILATTTQASTGGAELHIRGDRNAPVTLEEFGDYQCPPCGKIAAPLQQIEKDYGSKLCVVFHHYPLAVHAHAREAASAVEAAALQGKFWEMHDTVYREQAIWSKAENTSGLFAGYAGLIGLDVERFKRDAAGEEVKERIDRDVKSGERVGVKATPTFFVNNEVVEIASGDPVQHIRDAIDAALKKKESSG
jgi:protein-disulfide isomerase